MRLQFLTINIYGHTAVATKILRLRLTVQIQKNETLSEIIEMQIIGIQIDFLFLYEWLVFSQLIDLVIDYVLNQPF